MVVMVDPSDFTPPYNHQLCEAISRRGHQVFLVGSNPLLYLLPKQYTYISQFYSLSQRMRGLPKGVYLPIKGLEHLANMQALAMRLRKLQPKVIHFQWMPLPSIDQKFVPSLRKIAPVVFTVHDTQPFNGDPSSNLQVRGWLESLNSFDKLVVHTQFSAQQLVNFGIAPTKVEVIPIGSMDTMPKTTVPPDTSRANILFFGSIKPYKGLDILLRAVAQLKPSLKTRVKLKIHGRPQMDIAPLKLLTLELGIANLVEWNLGFVQEEAIPDLFYSANVVALPYRAIDASGVMTQALIYGRPVIASQIGGLADFVDEGKSGFLIPTENVELLADRLGTVLEDASLQSSMAAAAYRRARAMPTWDEIAGQTLALYEAIT